MDTIKSIEKKLIYEVLFTDLEYQTEGYNSSTPTMSKSVKSYKPNQIVVDNDVVTNLALKVKENMGAVFTLDRNIDISQGQLDFAFDAAKVILGTHFVTDKITLIPAKAGFGKSTFISSLMEILVEEQIKKHTPFWKNQGVIIVTDKLESLRELQENLNHTFGSLGGKDVAYILEGWNTNICKNFSKKIYEEGMCSTSKCEFFWECKISYQTIKQRYSPILMMTNARFFQLSEIDLREYREWIDNNGEKCLRNIILIDEKPKLVENKEVKKSIIYDLLKEVDSLDRGFTQIKGYLKNILDEAIRQFDYLEEIYPKEVSNDLHVFKGETSLITDEFVHVWKEYFQFNKLDEVKSLKDFFSTGGLVCSTSKIFKIKTLGSRILNYPEFKTFIFDATCELDPEYYGDRFQYLDIKDFKDYKNLNIHYINELNFSKNNLKKNLWLLDSVASWINGNFKENVFLVTYMDFHKKLDEKLKDNSLIIRNNESIPYFGMTKGSNLYRSAKDMVMVGWWKMPTDEYIAQYLSTHLNKEMLMSKWKMDEHHVIDFSNINGVFSDLELEEFRLCKMMVDFEQEVFRTKVRDFGCSEEVNIWIFNPEDRIKDLIKQRFPKCKMIKHDSPFEFQEGKTLNRKSKGANKIQLLINWFKKWDGTPVPTEEIRTKFEISKSYMDDLFRHNKKGNLVIKEIIRSRNIKRGKLNDKGRISWIYIKD